MTYQLSQVRLLVSDVKSCFKFYSGVLGLPVSWGDENSGYASFQAGDSVIALFDRQAMADSIGGGDRPSSTEGQDRVAIVMQVDDVDKEYQRLKTIDVSFLTEPVDREGWGIRTAHLRDPDGTLIEIMQEL